MIYLLVIAVQTVGAAGNLTYVKYSTIRALGTESVMLANTYITVSAIRTMVQYGDRRSSPILKGAWGTCVYLLK